MNKTIELCFSEAKWRYECYTDSEKSYMYIIYLQYGLYKIECRYMLFRFVHFYFYFYLKYCQQSLHSDIHEIRIVLPFILN